jgi:hypothetical protein
VCAATAPDIDALGLLASEDPETVMLHLVQPGRARRAVTSAGSHERMKPTGVFSRQRGAGARNVMVFNRSSTVLEALKPPPAALRTPATPSWQMRWPFACMAPAHAVYPPSRSELCLYLLTGASLVDANGHRSFVRVQSDVRRGFLCNPRLIVRRFLVEA